jgi:hypothetical protein
MMSNAGIKRKLGCISFGYLFFGQAKKSNSPTGEKVSDKQSQISHMGIHSHHTTTHTKKNNVLLQSHHAWIPAFAGMTNLLQTAYFWQSQPLDRRRACSVKPLLNPT